MKSEHWFDIYKDQLFGIVVVVLVIGFITGFAMASIDANRSAQAIRNAGYVSGWQDSREVYLFNLKNNRAMSQGDWPCAEDEVMMYIDGFINTVPCVSVDKAADILSRD